MRRAAVRIRCSSSGSLPSRVPGSAACSVASCSRNSPSTWSRVGLGRVRVMAPVSQGCYGPEEGNPRGPHGSSHRRPVGSRRPRGGGRAPRLRHPGRPQPRHLRRPARPARHRPYPRPPRAGRGVHGRRLCARRRRARRGRGHHGAGRHQRADAAGRVLRLVGAGAGPHVRHSRCADWQEPRRAPRGAEPDRLLPSRDPLGRGRARRDRHRRGGAGGLHAASQPAARSHRAVHSHRSAHGEGSGRASRARRRPPALRERPHRARRRAASRRASAPDHHRRRRGGGGRGGGAGRPRAAARCTCDHHRERPRRDAGDAIPCGSACCRIASPRRPRWRRRTCSSPSAAASRIGPPRGSC